MTKQDQRQIEMQVTADLCKRYPDIFLSTEQAAEALGTTRKKLGEDNEFGIKPAKRGRGYYYYRPLIIKAVIDQIT